MKERVACYVCNFCGEKSFGAGDGEEHPEGWFAMNVKDETKGARPVRKHVCADCADKHSLADIKEKLCDSSQTMLIL